MVIDIEAYQKFIERAIQEFETPSHPTNLYEPIQYILEFGGKRMRPVLTLMSCEMFGEEIDKAKKAAIAIELFHNFTLIHDDIMDKAPLRRGKDTIHVKWNEDIAILSGDALLIEAYKMIASYENDVLKKLITLFNKTASEVCEGQQMDMDFESEDVVSMEQYEEMIKLKTAVLLGTSLKMGAIIAGAKEEDAEDLYDFGLNLGIAFQLQDDILDVYGDEVKFGKKVGGDIIAKKKTFLLIEAYTKANSIQKQRLDEFFEKENDAEKVSGVMEIYEELEIKNWAENKMNSYYSKAINGLNEIGVDEDKKTPLKNLANYLLQREN